MGTVTTSTPTPFKRSFEGPLKENEHMPRCLLGEYSARMLQPQVCLSSCSPFPFAPLAIVFVTRAVNRVPIITFGWGRTHYRLWTVCFPHPSNRLLLLLPEDYQVWPSTSSTLG